MIYPNNFDSLLEELSNEYSKKNIQVMLGRKIKEGRITEEQCISFIVENRLPLDQLAPEDIIPSEIVVNGKHYITDVIEIKNAKVVACPAECDTWRNPATPPGNRNTVRPLVGGLSIGSKNYISPTECYLGTLGFIAVDRASQALVGVTNAHVVVKNPFVTVDQDLTKIAQNEASDYVYQTGETCTPNPSIQIGQVIRYVPLYKPQPANTSTNSYLVHYNLVDGALISLKQSDISNTESFKQYGLNYNLPLPFATTNEILDLPNRVPINLYSSGRTTGAKGENPCGLSFVGINTSAIKIDGYHLQGESSPASFFNTIMFASDNDGCVPLSSGDSGSALIANIGGVRKIIGLVFAEALINGTLQVGLACRIDWVADQLSIDAWDGTTKNFINPASIAYTTVPGKSYDPTIKKNGKIYWQVGLIDTSISTTTTTSTTSNPFISTTTSTSTSTSSTTTSTTTALVYKTFLAAPNAGSVETVCPFTNYTFTLYFTGAGTTYPLIGDTVYGYNGAVYSPFPFNDGNTWLKMSNGHVISGSNAGVIQFNTDCAATTTTTTTTI